MFVLGRNISARYEWPHAIRTGGGNDNLVVCKDVIDKHVHEVMSMYAVSLDHNRECTFSMVGHVLFIDPTSHHREIRHHDADGKYFDATKDDDAS